MRKMFVALFNFGSLAGLLVLVLLQPTEVHLAAEEKPQSGAALPATSGHAKTDSNPIPSEQNTPTKEDITPTDSPPSTSQHVEVADRVIRATALGWELIAPAALANKGLAPDAEASEFRKLGVATKLTESATLDDLERSIALGGDHAEGADIALLPLAAFVHRYERLRALKPQVFFVVGWSVGKDALYIHQEADFDQTRRDRTVRLVGAPGDAETLFSLAILKLSGTPLSKAVLVSAASAEATLAAVDRSRDDSRSRGRRAFLTSADAPHLCPYVAIASEGFLTAHEDLAARWTEGWLAGVEALRKDVPAAARQVGTLEGTPETVRIVRRLGQLDFSGLRQNAELAGLSGRGAVTLNRLFQLHWSIWREAGEISIPPPNVPIFNGTVATLVRKLRPRPRTNAVEYDMAGERLLSIELPAEDADAEIGLIGGLFSRSGLQVGVRGRRTPTAEALIQQAQARYDLNPERLVVSNEIPRGMKQVLHVLRTP